MRDEGAQGGGCWFGGSLLLMAFGIGVLLGAVVSGPNSWRERLPHAEVWLRTMRVPDGTSLLLSAEAASATIQHVGTETVVIVREERVK